MAEITQTLADQEKKDIFTFSSFDEIIAAMLIGIVSIIVLVKLPFQFAVNLGIAVTMFVVLFLTYRYYVENHFKLLIYRQSYKNVSFFDKRMEKFLNVRAIRGNSILFEDNTLMAILRIKPIDGSLLDDDELATTLAAYDASLKGTQHTMHIFSHSVLPNYDDFFEHIEEKIIQHGGDYESMLKLSRSKQKWLVEKMKETHSRDRLNYFAIHYRKQDFRASIVDSMLFLVGLKKFQDIQGSSMNEETIDKAITDLTEILANVMQQLKKTNVDAVPLTDDELMNLYSSYFLNIRGVGKSNLSPIMWLEE